MEDLRGERGGGFGGPAGLGRALVLEQAAVQGVRGEAGARPDPLQCRFRLLLQPLPARPLRDPPRPLQRVSTPKFPKSLLSLSLEFGAELSLI